MKLGVPVRYNKGGTHRLGLVIRARNQESLVRTLDGEAYWYLDNDLEPAAIRTLIIRELPSSDGKPRFAKVVAISDKNNFMVVAVTYADESQRKIEEIQATPFSLGDLWRMAYGEAPETMPSIGD